jgi:hypothetical protein
MTGEITASPGPALGIGADRHMEHGSQADPLFRIGFPN